MLRAVTVTVLGVFVLLFAGLGRSPLYYLESLRRALSDSDYSSAFRGVVPFDTVLVSATDRSGDMVKDSCLMVVVGLTEDAPATPPDETRSLDGWFVIGGRWRETPERMKLAAAPDLLETCGHLADPETLLYLMLFARPAGKLRDPGLAQGCSADLRAHRGPCGVPELWP